MLLPITPLFWGLSIQAFEFATKLKRADIAYIQSGFYNGCTSCNLHCGAVEAHLLHELNGAHRRDVLELAMKNSAAHASLGGHTVNRNWCIEI